MLPIERLENRLPLGGCLKVLSRFFDFSCLHSSKRQSYEGWKTILNRLAHSMK